MVSETAPKSPVSASEFVRRFASYARQAEDEPVMIAQYGRVVLSLVSAPFLETIIKPSSEGNEIDHAKLDIVFDTISTLVTIIDRKSAILRINAAARRYFGIAEKDALHQPFTKLVQGTNGLLVQGAIDRVLATGQAEELVIDSVKYPGRTLRVHVVPFPEGAGVFSDDVTDSTALRKDQSAYASLSHALEGAGIGYGRVNSRGMIAGACATLADMCEAALDRIIGLRLASLFEAKSRWQINDLLEQALVHSRSGVIDAELLSLSSARAVKFSIAPIHDIETGSGAVFIVRDAT